jgi:hypothetical protein
MTEKDALPTYGMPQPESSSEENEKPRLSPIQRMGAIFMSPGEVFADINRKPDFIAPILVMAVLSVVFSFFFQWRVNVDPREIAQRATEQRLEKQGKRMRDLSDQEREQVEKGIEFSVKFQKFLPYVAPLFTVIGLLFLAVIYFVGTLLIRGQTTFGKIFSVTTYASFATDLVQYILTGIIISLRPPDVDAILRASGSFAMSNPAGFFPADTAGWILVIARSLDFFKLWFVVLIAIGLAAICYKKRTSQTVIIPAGWWFLGTAVGVIFAIITRS